MSAGSVERRQYPRTRVNGGLECRLDLRTRVRMLDISLGGTLLAAELSLPVGVAAELRSGIGATTFRSEVQVRRSVGLPVGVPLNGLGAMFTTMDERSRKSLEEFLRKASQ